MEKIDFIEQKLEMLQNLEREKVILIAGINEFLKELTYKNVYKGEITDFKGCKYEIIAINPCSIYYYKEIKDLQFEILCLRCIKGEKNKTEMANLITKNIQWCAEHYCGKENAKLRKYYRENIIQLSRKLI